MNRKQIVVSISAAMLACSMPAAALAQEAAVPGEPAAVTAGLGLTSEQQDTDAVSAVSDAVVKKDDSSAQKAERKVADSAQQSDGVQSSSATKASSSSQNEKVSVEGMKTQTKSAPAKAAAGTVLPDLTFGIGTYKDTGEDIVLDKVLYSYTVNSSTSGVTVDGNYYVIPLQPVKDWLAANAPEYRLAGALNGASTVRAYSKNSKYILEVEKNPDYKPKPDHILIMKIGFKKADGTVVYSRDVYADDSFVTEDGTQYWVSTASLHEWLAQHPGYRTVSTIPAADSKGQCVPVKGEFPYSYLYEVAETEQPEPDKPVTPDTKKPETGDTKKDDDDTGSAKQPSAKAEAKARQVTAKKEAGSKKKTLPQTGDANGALIGTIALVGILVVGVGAFLRRLVRR